MEIFGLLHLAADRELATGSRRRALPRHPPRRLRRTFAVPRVPLPDPDLAAPPEDDVTTHRPRGPARGPGRGADLERDATPLDGHDATLRRRGRRARRGPRPSRSSRATRAAWSRPTPGPGHAAQAALHQRPHAPARLAGAHRARARPPVPAQRPLPRPAGRPGPRGRVEAPGRAPRPGTGSRRCSTTPRGAARRRSCWSTCATGSGPAATAGEGRVFVDREDVVDYVVGFRPPHATDVAGTRSGPAARWPASSKSGLLIGARTDDRFEISEAVEPLLPLELLRSCWRSCAAATSRHPRVPRTGLFDGPEPTACDDARATRTDDGEIAERTRTQTSCRRPRRPRGGPRGGLDGGLDEDGAERAQGLFSHQLVANPSDDTLQWRAELLQLVNWGGFSGRAAVDLRADATMISGASGVGKSTVLDAYTALLMPSDAKFNGASNDAVAGPGPGRGPAQPALLPARCRRRRRRPAHRSAGRDAAARARQRHVGRDRDDLRQRPGAPLHGAAHLLRAAPRDPLRATCRCSWPPIEAPVDLSTLEAAVPDRFHANTLKKLYPGIRVHRTYAEFAALLHARLGIGANGDGAKALRLLARIQAGNQVRSVDELYKDMVLERPATFAAADRAIEHFDDLESAYRAMRTEEQKQELLAPITDLHERRTAARARGRGARRLRGDGRRATPRCGSGCCAPTRRLLEAAVAGQPAGSRAGRRRAARQPARGDGAGGGAGGRQAGAPGRGRRHPGAARRRDRAGAGAPRRARRPARLAAGAPRTAGRPSRTRRRPGGEPAARSTAPSRTPWSRARRSPRWWHGPSGGSPSTPGAAAALVERRDQVMGSRYPLMARGTELQRERSSLAGRAGRVPEQLHALRAEVARASGLGPDELPFLAELVDVAPEEARWRPAVETVLGGAARLMLVPLERLEHFSAADRHPAPARPADLRGRRARPARRRRPARPRPGRGQAASSRDSPFRGWVQPLRRRALPQRAAAWSPPTAWRGTGCGSRWPARPGRDGSGSHGRGEQRSIIGFSNADALAELDARAGRARGRRWPRSTQRLAEVESATRVLDQQRTAYDAVRAHGSTTSTWRPATTRIAELERRREEILVADDRLERAGAADRRRSRRGWRRPGGQRFRLDERPQARSTPSTATSSRPRTRSPTSSTACIERRRRGRSRPEQAARLDEEFAAAVGSRRPGRPGPLPRELRRGCQARLTRRGRARPGRGPSRPSASWRPSSAPTSSSGRTPTSAPSRGLLPRLRAHPRRHRGDRPGPAARGVAAPAHRVERAGPGAARRRDVGLGRGDRGPARADQRDPAPAGVRRREGPAADPAAPAGAGPRPGLRARPARALPGAVGELDEEQMEARFAQLRRFMDQLRRPEHGLRRRARLRPRPAARRTPARGDQRRALRPAHRRAARDLPDAGGEERRREPGARRVHRRLGPAVPARRRDALAAALRAGLPRRGLRRRRTRSSPAARCGRGRGWASSWSSGSRWTRSPASSRTWTSCW